MIRFVFAVAFSAFLCAPAFAQQKPVSPSELAIQIDAIVNQWAQQITADQQTIAALQAEIATLKAKYEPQKSDTAK